MNHSILTMTTDFGLGPFAGIMKGIILSIAPKALIVDLSHNVPSQDIRAGAMVIEQALEAFGPGTIHLGVVDPTVGSDRRPICLKACDMYFIGPDNGLFTACLEKDSKAQIRLLNESRFFRPQISNTFHGRDVFAPVAAHLASGVDFEELGPLIEDPVRLSWPKPDIEDGKLKGCLLGHDDFGNLTTNISRTEVEAYLKGNGAIVSLGGLYLRGIVSSYSVSPVGAVVAVFDSLGRLELAINQGNLKEKLGLETEKIYGMQVTVSSALAKR